jgi:hypothetical protein
VTDQQAASDHQRHAERICAGSATFERAGRFITDAITTYGLTGGEWARFMDILAQLKPASTNPDEVTALRWERAVRSLEDRACQEHEAGNICRPALNDFLAATGLG